MKRATATPRLSGRLLKMGSRPTALASFSGRMALAVLLGVATIGSSIGLMATSAYLIAMAALQPSIADLQIAIVGVRFFGITRGVARYLERYVAHDATFRLLARLRVWFYAALEPLAPARLLHYRSGDLLARIVADIGTLEDFYLRVLAPPLVALLVAGLTGALLGSLDLRLALVALTFLLLAGGGVPLMMRAAGRASGQRFVQVRAELNGALVDGVQGLADLLAFGQGGRYLDRLHGLDREWAALQARITWLDGLQSGLLGLTMNLAILTLLAVAIPLVSSAQLDGVYLAVVVLAVMASFEAVWPLPQAFQQLDASLEAAGRLFEIVDTQPAVVDPPSPAPLPDLQSSSACRWLAPQVGLRVQDLRFTYNPGEAPALDGLSFELSQGKRLALVGPSGAGKSTLVSLLLRFWDYQDGHILLGKQELRECGQDQVRNLFAVVSQHTHLFTGTVRDNLLLARPEAGEAEMIAAAERAQIHATIHSLPQGYDTFLGEQGVRLSGGERQRLAIARAILKDAPFLLLDEPSANLDALTERELLATLQEWMIGRTTLLITHRLVGLETMNEVLVLQSGRIVERGRHQELSREGGLYQRMWELQTELFQDPMPPAS